MSGLGMEYHIDVVMCIDTTTEQGFIIDDIKKNALTFYQQLVDVMDERMSEFTKLRVKVITFTDCKTDIASIRASEFFVLPEQSCEFDSFVQSIEVGVGGNTRDNALEALALAIKSDWTTEGDKRRHIILMFSVAPAYSRLGANTDSPYYPEGMPTTMEQLTAWWQGADDRYYAGRFIYTGRFIAFVPKLKPWTELCKWDRYYPAFIEADARYSYSEAIELMTELL